MSVIVGLSGGIGTGKSTVGRMLEKRGATLIDADEIVRELQAPGSPVLQELARAFGSDILRPDGSLDREALGAVAFRDPTARARLGELMHPRVIGEMLRRAVAARDAGDPVIVLDIPLLFEGRLTGTGSAAVLRFDVTVLVYAPEEAQIERQIARNGYDREEALRRVRAQVPIEEKRALADVVIENGGALEETEREVDALYARLRERAAAAP